MQSLSTSHHNTCHFSIIFGGLSPEHPASVASFENVLESFKTQGIDNSITSIYYFTKENAILYNKYSADKSYINYRTTGAFCDLNTAIKNMSEEKTFHINLLHGNLGEDGHIQGLSRYFGLMGSFGSVLPASLAMSKYHMAHYVSSMIPSVKLPDTLCLSDRKFDMSVALVKKKFSRQDVVVKPNSLGASLFTHKYQINEGSEHAVSENIKRIFEYDRFALVQQFISGREYSVGCLNMADRNIVLDVVEIKTSTGFFGHEEKHQKDKAEEIVITDDTPITAQLKNIALEIFEATGFEYMCRFDFIVTEDNTVYFLEANPIPGLMKNSIFPKMLRAKNLSIPEIFSGFNRAQHVSLAKEPTFDYIIE